MCRCYYDEIIEEIFMNYGAWWGIC